MRNKLLIVLAVLLLLGGLSVFLYPTFKTAVLRRAEQGAISDFENYRATATAPSPVAPTDGSCEANTETEGEPAERIFPELWAACVAFNEQLPETQKAAYTADSLRLPSVRVSDYGWEQDTFGYLSIPASGIEVPLYLGANNTNMNKGAAVLGQTSMPIGGTSTNCVIAGHRTWSGAVSFKGLEQLNVGDQVYLTNPWETLTYEVIETKVVLPDTVDEVMVHEGQDLLTVFTCTYPNTRRYMVICERVMEGESNTWNWMLLPWVAAPLN